MTCPACGTDNEPGGKFCEACGTPLNAACPSCGQAVRPDARFCRNCGHQLAAPATDAPAAPAPAAPANATRAAAVAERRIVTVLFVDLVGFTTLAEDRDPESTRELLTAYFDRAREAIDRHGGTVEKFIGDAVMAVWGTPVAHEDDAERAVRAGFEILDAVRGLGPELHARAGLMTGEAAVTIGATDQGMVAGDLVNTAARLQGVADPGTILVGEATMRAAEQAITFEPVGDHDLKGKVAPVPAWRATRVVAARGGVMRTDALEPPFVGRDEELRLLKEQLHAPGRDQRARLVSITGPGGIGKSRLVWELEKYVDGVTEPIYWHRGRSPSYGEGIAFWALGEMVRRRAGLTEDADDATTRERLGATVAEYVADPDERAIVEPALHALLGLDAVDGGRDALFPAWRLFFERISERGTVALVFEDLQWADSGLLDFIDHLLDWVKARPILVITLARPELFDRRPDWGAGRRSLAALGLEPLSDDAMRELLDGVVPGLPASTVAAIVERAEGVPLYAVETVRTLLANGRIERDGDVYRPVGDVVDLAVPESLRSLIAARLDALDPSDRELLQDAAVLGQVFDLPALAAVTGIEPDELETRLRGFVRRELIEIETDPTSPERGQFKFVQALIREVAYSTLALRDRRSRHLAIARHYEALDEGERAGALASHYCSALETSAEGPEADAVAAQARIALRAAADRASSLGAHAQALAHIDRALAIATDEAERADLLERAAVASMVGVTGNAEDYARRALVAREAVGDVSGTYRTAALVGGILLDLNKLDDATAVLTDVLGRDGEPGPEAEAELWGALARAHMRSNRLAEAIEAADRALMIAEPRNLTRIVADALNNRAAALTRYGRRREATALMETAVHLADAGGWQALGLRLRNNLAVAITDDDPARSTKISAEMVEIAERIGNVQWYVMSAAGLSGGLYSEMREWDRALALSEDAIARDVPGAGSWQQTKLSMLEIFAARGIDSSGLLADIEAYDPSGMQRWWVDMSLADAALWTGDYATAVDRARACLTSDWSDSNESYVRAQLVQALVGLGRLDEARAEVQALRDSVYQGTTSKALLTVSEAGVLALEGRTAEARPLFEAGFAELRRLVQLQDLVRWQVDAALLLPGAPEVGAWLAESRATAERVGAVALIERIDAIMGAPVVRPMPATHSAPVEAPTEA